MAMLSILSLTTTQLSEFVANIVPKIWTGTLFSTNQRLNSFQHFCQNILKATQINHSCVLVALYYIYRLRFAYPSIRGSMGSEVRLFTTALILANKFLDDNTFTSKTWSEVSCVPLRELNIMEMEFLSALQYRTCIHQTQFFAWANQCQYWLTQLRKQPSRLPSAKRSCEHIVGVDTKKKMSSIRHPHPYKRLSLPIQLVVREPMLSWSSSTYYQNQLYYPHYSHRYHFHPANAASAVATAAAVTAMNLDYSNFYT
ncbi:hypothetical protein EDC96DRAFT_17205 [Choanephora cucurbitarum]|nr:hypothetical protein EDC96DRAFT_17205 [Choanephora cucurbitarum]